MAHFIKQAEIPLKVRRPHLESYRQQLRQALLNPGLSSDRKEQILFRLQHVGKPKPYAELAAIKAAPNTPSGE